MTRQDKIIVTCGEFDNLNVDDVKFLQKCRKKGDWLIVGVHSDWWMQWCRGSINSNYDSRREIVSQLKCVDEVLSFSDMDGTVCQLLKIVKAIYPNAEIIYVSDTDMHNQPETKIKGITFEIIK